MKKYIRSITAFGAMLTAFSVFAAPLVNVAAATNSSAQTQPEIVAKLNFDPKVNGFGFENFGNDARKWQDDLGAEDMIRLFGAEAVCRTGNTAANCVLKAAAREWMMQQLEGMNGGHCEGMAATSLRLATSKAFKSKASAPQFQPGAKMPFQLKLDQTIENYIAYYFVTQSLEEVSEATAATIKNGPVGVVNMLVDSFKAGNDTYSLGFYKYKDGRKFDGHAITPIAVEDAGANYRIHVYDNNYPGETRYVVVEKAGKQTWKYVTSTNPNEPAAEYAGNIDTKTLELTSTAVRDRGCFSAPFADDATSGNCVPVIEKSVEIKKPVEDKKPADKQEETAVKEEGEMAEFALNGEADLLIVTGDGKQIGYDPKTNKFVNEVAGAEVVKVKGGKGVDLPLYRLPFQSGGKPYNVVISGENNQKESNVDLTYSAPGFAIGFDGIRVDPNEVLLMTVAPDGEALSFTASTDGETPEIYFAVDGDDESYKVELDGATMQAGKTLTVTFDDEAEVFKFSDNDGDEDKYDVDVTRFTDDGKEQDYETDDIDTGKVDNYQMDFGKWKGDGAVGVKTDDEGNGFADDETIEQEEEDNDDDADDADDEGDDEDADVDGDGKLNDDDEDDDGDGTSDEKDTDDDGDGDPDTEDDDDNEDGEEEDEDGDGLVAAYKQENMNFFARLLNW